MAKKSVAELQATVDKLLEQIAKQNQTICANVAVLHRFRGALEKVNHSAEWDYLDDEVQQAVADALSLRWDGER